MGVVGDAVVPVAVGVVTGKVKCVTLLAACGAPTHEYVVLVAVSAAAVAADSTTTVMTEQVPSR